MSCGVMGCPDPSLEGKLYCGGHLENSRSMKQAIEQDRYQVVSVLGDFPEGSFLVRVLRKTDPEWLVRLHINALVHSLSGRPRTRWSTLLEQPSPTGLRLWQNLQLRRFDWDVEQKSLVEVPHENPEGSVV